MVYGRKGLVVSYRRRRGTRGNFLLGGTALDRAEGSSIPWLRGLAHPIAGSDRKSCPWKDRASPGWDFGFENRLFDLETVTPRWTNANGVDSKVEIGRSVEGRAAEEEER
jgi:hypothetical protein